MVFRPVSAICGTQNYITSSRCMLAVIQCAENTKCVGVIRMTVARMHAVIFNLITPKQVSI